MTTKLVPRYPLDVLVFSSDDTNLLFGQIPAKSGADVVLNGSLADLPTYALRDLQRHLNAVAYLLWQEVRRRDDTTDPDTGQYQEKLPF